MVKYLISIYINESIFRDEELEIIKELGKYFNQINEDFGLSQYFFDKKSTLLMYKGKISKPLTHAQGKKIEKEFNTKKRKINISRLEELV